MKEPAFASGQTLASDRTLRDVDRHRLGKARQPRSVKGQRSVDLGSGLWVEVNAGPLPVWQKHRGVPVRSS